MKSYLRFEVDFLSSYAQKGRDLSEYDLLDLVRRVGFAHKFTSKTPKDAKSVDDAIHK
jgi:hypothetical protein